MSTTQGIKLDDETQRRLKALAAKRERSPHWLMRKAIEEYLQSQERYENEKDEDMKRWANYELTGQAADNEAVSAWLQKLADGQIKPWQK